MTSAPKAALITGAARRIGRAVALELAGAGYAIGVHYQRSESEAQALVSELTARGTRAVAVQAELHDEAQSRGLLERAISELGPITCLVNNASAFERDEVDTATRASWDLHMEVNLRAPFVLSQELVRHLPEGPEGVEGHIVNLLDQRVLRLTPHFTTYTLSKVGLWTLTQTLAMALAPRVRVNAVAPGPTLPSVRQSQSAFERQWAASPLERPVSPDDVARAVRFLLEVPSITGQLLCVDSGQHLGWPKGGAGHAPDE